MCLMAKTLTFVMYNLAICIFTYYLHLSYFISTKNDWLFDNGPKNDIYDLIIVGAGSAGSTLAARLRNGGSKILLIEAGPSAAYLSDIPILAPLLQNSPYDWQYKTIPQKYACKGLINNQSSWPQGKVLGGSGRLNYMAYVTGHPEDYASWFSEYTAYGLEKEIINEPRWNTHFLDTIVEAARQIAPEFSNDFRKVVLTSRNGKRWSADRLLEEKCTNGDLTVMTHGRVDRLIFGDGETSVSGLQVTRHSREFKVFARQGVVVSAGAIGSPKLLMLSGIGPKKHLQDLGIKVVRDLPVGENLVDHVLTGLDLVTLNISSPMGIEDVLNPISALAYSLFGQGPWTSAGIEALGNFDASSENVGNEKPALQLMMIPLGVSQDDGILLRKSMGISDQVFEKYFRPLVHQTVVTIAPVLLHPKSSGCVKLQSANPTDHPLIDPNYLSHKDDIDILVSGIELVKKLLNTEAMKKVGASLYQTKFPGCESFDFDSRKYWECYIRHLTLTTYHPAGTCRIGRVVDESFGVLGMKNLWIVDASVLPELPSGNINAAVMMLSEKAAKLLKKTRTRRAFVDDAKFHSYLLALYGANSDIIRAQELCLTGK